MNQADYFVYTPATTDVTIRWKNSYGWIPPTQDPAYQRKQIFERFLLLALKA